MAKSPSITIKEIDKSSYTVTNSQTVLAIIGYGTKGPTDKPQMITSKNEFIKTFGTIPSESPLGHLAAYRAFNQTNKIIYQRVADDTAVEATIVLSQPGYQEFSTPTSATIFSSSETYTFDIAVNGAGASTITIVADGEKTLTEIAALIDAELTGATCAVNSSTNLIRVTSDEYDGTISITNLSVDFGALFTTSIAVAPKDTITFTAQETGEAGNEISVKKTSYIDPVTSNVIHTIEVYYNSAIVETFNNVSLDTNEDTYFVDVINKSIDNGGSEYISVTANDVNASGAIVLENGEFVLAGGTNGIPTSLDDEDSLFIAALGIDSYLANPELFDFHILITPDIQSQAVQDAAITLANSSQRQDFIYIVDPPIGLTYDQVTDWHNGIGEHGRTSALNNSFTATYWPWLKDYNPKEKEYTWVPGSVFLAETYLTADNNTGPWSAPAGETRGKLISSDIETSPSFAQREVLYGDPNAVNPIVEFNSKGIIVYGQKTTYRGNSAVNRISARRTIIYIKKLIRKAMEGIVFEPHTPASWNKASLAINDILQSVASQGGLSDYFVQIDGDTNTESLIAQGIMSGIVTVIPVGTIERIELGIKFLSPGTIISED